MKKIGLMVVTVSLALGLTAFAAQEPPKAERSGPKDRVTRGEFMRSPKALANQIAELKQEHQAAVKELEEIKKLATEEKATKTAGALDKLIARRNQEFQKRIEPLEQQLKKLEGAKGGDETNKAKTGKGKSRTRG